jgi:hypothetical protein
VSESGTTGGSGGDFRGSREEKRQDETVMISSENLSDMVANAKQGDTVEPNTPASDEDELADSQFGRILVILGIIAVVFAVAIIVWVNVINN